MRKTFVPRVKWGKSMRMILITAAVFSSLSGAASAGFGSWTTDVEKDPFSGGVRVTVDISTSLRSGVVIFCDSAQTGLQVRAIPGFAFTDELAGYKPQIEFAIDGQRILGEIGRTGAVGDNIAAAEVDLVGAAAAQFVDAFAKASKQVAIKDGISDRPHLLSARGSTKAGAALVACIAKQAN
jgi:hypothetical protein